MIYVAKDGFDNYIKTDHDQSIFKVIGLPFIYYKSWQFQITAHHWFWFVCHFRALNQFYFRQVR